MCFRLDSQMPLDASPYYVALGLARTSLPQKAAGQLDGTTQLSAG